MPKVLSNNGSAAIFNTGIVAGSLSRAFERALPVAAPPVLETSYIITPTMLDFSFAGANW